MMRINSALFVGLCFLLNSAISLATPLSLAEFQAKMQAEMQQLPGSDNVSLEVQVLGSNQRVFSHGAENFLVPASAMKVLTTQAAFAKMGEGFHFSTNVWLEGSVQGDTIDGNLVLQGNGDPFFVDERITALAQAVQQLGIKHITGGIKVNNSAFSEDYMGLVDWSSTNESFAAIVSATSLNFNSIEVHVSPGNGPLPNATLYPVPHAYAVLVNKLQYVAGSHSSIAIKMIKDTSTQQYFELSGTVGRSAPDTSVYATVSNPAAYVADAFSALLRAEGIQVAQDFVGESFNPADVPTTLLTKQDSLPLQDLAGLYLPVSNNFMAEEVFQGLGSVVDGGPAAFLKSQQVVLDYVQRTSSCRDVVIDNGSGLSWKTRVSAKCFADYLQDSYRDFSEYTDLINSMPIGGKTGTLRNRFQKHDPDFVPENVRAKTGTLWSQTTVTSLVGVTPIASGQVVVFAIVQNDARGSSSLLQGMRDWEDACVELMQRLSL